MGKTKFLEGFLSSVFGLIKFLISLRYRIEVRGLEELKRVGKSGILFLPNHSAEIDPIILMRVLWQAFRPRPLVVENFYYLKGGLFFMQCVRALPVPNMDNGTNKWKLHKLEKLFSQITEELKKGENFLIYPAGKLKLTEQEAIGGASFVHNLLKECPNAAVVLIRTRGLWGSRFSRGLTGKVPDFGKVFWEGAKILLKNGIFFAPRRKVIIEVEPAPADFPSQGARLDLNRYLEEWYNRKPDHLTLVSDYFWKRKVPEVVGEEGQGGTAAKVFVSPNIEQEVFQYLAKLSRRPVGQIRSAQHLSQDLGLDSLDGAQVYAFLNERYEVDLEPGQLQTVEDVLQAAAGGRKERARPKGDRSASPAWFAEGSRLPPEEPVGETLQEAFLRSCERMGGSIACADALSGVLTYRQLKRAALVLSLAFQKLPGERIGVLLPSSVGAYVTILALLLAKKVPMMLNWTVGVRSLDHALELTGAQAVISSRRFLDRLENGDLGALEDRLVFLEDVKNSLSWKEKLQGLWMSVKSPKQILGNVRKEDPAVILFTSGTEALPKAVPLSHHNLLSNQRAALSCIQKSPGDILYGVLPPFHSFGFSVTGLLPLLAGMKVCYAPDPTDSHGLAHDIAHWKATFFCCAPSFIKALFRVADPAQLKSLHLIVSGAEKAPAELFEYADKLGAQFLEGYGITECGPIVTLCRPGAPRKGPRRGVGQPLPGVELKVFGEDSEICIRGPNVFAGYLGDIRSPFITLDGQEWYRSGDCGSIDPDGTLVLSGRLKRFVKIGGEMVGLEGLEGELLRLCAEKQWQKASQEGPALAVTVQEKESEKPLIILFTTFAITKEEVNAALNECGFGRIAKVGEVRQIDQIPLTGTGKTHYRSLDEQLE
jgi:long-chain-fatty-acid--[acyl-carrier-protein] ligase